MRTPARKPWRQKWWESRLVRPAPTLRRITLELAAVYVLHFFASFALARFSVPESILSAGPGGRLALLGMPGFFALRLFVLLFAPGWFLARIWILLTRRRTEQRW